MGEKDSKTQPMDNIGRPPAPPNSGGYQNNPGSGLVNQPRPPQPGAASDGGGRFADRTTVLNQPGGGPNPQRPGMGAGGAGPSPSFDDGMKTTVVGRHAPADVQAAAEVRAPVVGWAVVVRGPGQSTGQTFELTYGKNAVGRNSEPTTRVRLTDDMQVSRDNSLHILYDRLGREFIAMAGGGQALAFIKGKPVIEPVRLDPYADIQLGETILRVVPLCGPEFDWTKEETIPNLI